MILIDDLKNAIDNYSRNIELEKRCMIEIENYSIFEMEMHKAESIRWSEQFDADINRTEIDIQISTAELEGTKISFERTIRAIRLRDQEMFDFVALKEKRTAQKDSDLMKLIGAHRDHLLTKCGVFGKL